MEKIGHLITQNWKELYHVWVLAPYLEKEDPHLHYYYDYSQSIAEYTKVFEELGMPWTWQPVTLQNIESTVYTIKSTANGRQPLVLNLCDGDEVNGAPGLSVIHALEKFGLTFTGANAFFYDVTTSKIVMKTAFDQAQVPTAGWRAIDDQSDAYTILSELGAPLIIKPSVSGGSMGLGVKNVVTTPHALQERVAELQQGYKGWTLSGDGLFVEQFIAGREFTVLISGSTSLPAKLHVYPAVERVFHDQLPDHEKFLSYDRLWETYEAESPMPSEDFVYQYAPPPPELLPKLSQISLQAYEALQGHGYGRVDLRMAEKTGEIFVLEVNAQCGLSEDENYTSIGAILRFAGRTFSGLIEEILQDAIQRHHINNTTPHHSPQAVFKQL